MPEDANTVVAPKILIIEDQEEDFKTIHELVRGAIEGRSPQPEVIRVHLKDDLDTQLGNAEGKTKVLIIFDRVIRKTFGYPFEFDLDSYILDLWNTDHRTWRGQIPIIVYSVMLKHLSGLKRRAHRIYVSKIQRGADEPLDKLQEAIQDCVNSLYGRGSNS